MLSPPNPYPTTGQSVLKEQKRRTEADFWHLYWRPGHPAGAIAASRVLRPWSFSRRAARSNGVPRSDGKVPAVTVLP